MHVALLLLRAAGGEAFRRLTAQQHVVNLFACHPVRYECQKLNIIEKGDVVFFPKALVLNSTEL